ncbi:MAG TPA: thioredoxin [Burkholderiales bacterium]|jgi:putative thioredoxin|nr:thioredoxin [Burkholderiales bacterium]
MDVTTASFEQEVIEASKRLPVVVDFWAPWCGPCRALTPVIEKVAGEFAGRLKLVKVNSDENSELSSAFGIRSIPNVIAFKAGRPAAQFLGAVPESQVRAFMQKLLPSPSELALARAEAAFAAHRLDEAERELAAVDPDPSWDARLAALRQGIAYARAGKEGPGEAELRARLAADPADHEARLALAAMHAGQRRYREAMDELLEIVRRARDWRDGEARRQLLALFSLAGDAELVSEYRRKLAAALY